MNKRIPIAQPDLSGNEEAYVQDAVKSTWISSMGKYVDRFEREFSARLGVEDTISTSSGTTALHLALKVLGAKPGTNVIVPSLSFVATANAVRYTGAEPVFVDVDPNTWCIDPVEVEGAIDEHAVGIIPVHLYGYVADMEWLMETAQAAGLWVLEDAAEAHGALFRDQYAGSFGDLATFSFYGNKIMTCGEGGAVTDRTGIFARELRLLRGQGMDPKHRYYHPVVGYNYRLTNVACAMLCAQMERFNELVEARRRIWQIYRTNLADLGTFQTEDKRVRSACWMTGIVFDTVEHREAVVASLKDDNIETRPFFEPIHTFPPYAGGPPLPVTSRLAACGLCLPTYAGLQDEEIARVIARVKAA
jgi:perosamine synthetase